MDGPLVSIIIPCFNTERLVRDAINSALQQTWPHREVIVIDDGSTDGSLNTIKAFGDHIRWEATPNRGACAARNRGIALARGEFIQFLDADDILYPSKIERQLAVVSSQLDVLVFCDAESDGPVHPHHSRTDSVEDAVIFMLRSGLQTSAPLHRREWLQTIGGFREDLPCSQERDLHLRIAAAEIRFQRLPEALYIIRRQPQSLSSNMERVLDQHAKIISPIYDTLKQRGMLTEARRREFAGLLARDARTYIRLGKIRKAHEYFRQAQLMHADGGIPLAYRHSARIARHLIGSVGVEVLGSLRRK